MLFQFPGEIFLVCKRCQDYACLIKVYQVSIHCVLRRSIRAGKQNSTLFDLLCVSGSTKTWPKCFKNLLFWSCWLHVPQPNSATTDETKSSPIKDFRILLSQEDMEASLSVVRSKLALKTTNACGAFANMENVNI